MTEETPSSLPKARRSPGRWVGPWRWLGLWVVAVTLVFPLFAVWGAARLGGSGLLAAAAAAAVVGTSGGAALWLVHRSRRVSGSDSHSSQTAVNGILAATLVRTSAPLAAMFFGFSVVGGAVGECFTTCLVGYFLFGLVVETLIMTCFAARQLETVS